MNLQDCITFANENPVCSFATVEDEQPRVRLLGFWFADETGFYFQTALIKEIPKQLEANPKAEVCFYKPGQPLGTMLRIAGETEFITDKKLKEKCMKDRPFLKEFGLTVESPGLVLFRISHGKAHFWNMENNVKPKQYIEF